MTMRLLFCCESYYPSLGGVQEVMRQIAERMVLAGHQVTVATSRISERNFKTFNGVEIREFGVTGNLERGLSGEIDRYRDYVHGFGADAILIKAAQQWTFDALWPVLGQIASRKVFIPCGFSGLYEPAYQQYFAQMPQVLREFDHLIFYSEKYRDIDFARAHGLAHFSVVPNGASELEFGTAPDPSFRGRLAPSNEEFIFLSVGSPILAKGYRQIAEAFARLDIKGRSATLVLNGDWPQPVQIRSPLSRHHISRPATAPFRSGWKAFTRTRDTALRLAAVYAHEGLGALQTAVNGRKERLQLARETDEWVSRANAQPGKRVIRANMDRAELVQAYMAADLFVFASIVEYSPLVLFEAAAAGTPFLSVPVGNAEEIARWTGGGMICPAAKDERGYTRVDPSVLAREMERCMGDPDMLARVGAAGKERWRRMFTWQAIAPQYESILSGRTGGQGPQDLMSGETAARA